MLPPPRTATLLDLVTVLQDLREEDQLELAAWGTHDPMDALDTIMQDTIKLRTITNPEGSPLAVYGASRQPGEPETGRIWMLHREGASASPRVYLEGARKVLPEIAEGFKLLWNYKWAGNAHHLPWLRRLGFITLQAKQFGDNPFIEFMRPT